MKGQLNNLNLSYVEAEDRILMTISTTENEEIRFWITRLYSRHLFDLMLKILNVGNSTNPETERQLALERQQAMQEQLRAQQKAAEEHSHLGGGGNKDAQQPNPQQNQPQQQPAQPNNTGHTDPNQGGKAFPIGEIPTLLTKLVVEPISEDPNSYLLKMHPAEGVGVDLRVDRNLVHNLCQLISQIEIQAGWNLSLQMPGAQAIATVSASDALN